EREMIPMCVDLSVSILPWSPLARGRLARPAETRTERTEQDAYGKTLFASISDGDREIIRRVGELADKYSVTMASVALAWLHRQSNVSAPVIGATKLHHLEDAISSLDVELAIDDLVYLQEPYVTRSVAGFNDVTSIGTS